MSLYDDLAKIGEQVKSQLPQMKNNESATVHVSVLPFIRALGYNTQDLSEVYPEYSILNMDAVDYAVLRDGAPIMVVEAKKAGASLGYKEWKQLYEYFNADKARVGILTNGKEYRFYTDMAKPNIMDDQPFLDIDLLNLDQKKVGILEGFTKARFNEAITIRYMKLRSRVFIELSQPSDWLVKQLIWEIHDGPKWKTVLDEYRPLVQQAVDEYVNAAADVVPPPPPPPSNSDLPQPQTKLDGSVEIHVLATWKEHQFNAVMKLAGKLSNAGNHVLWDGNWQTRRKAAEAAVRTVDPEIGYVNGLTFWHFRDPDDGRLRPVNDLYDAWYNDWDFILRVIRNVNQ